MPGACAPPVGATAIQRHFLALGPMVAPFLEVGVPELPILPSILRGGTYIEQHMTQHRNPDGLHGGSMYVAGANSPS